MEGAVALGAFEDVGTYEKATADTELELFVSLLGDVLFTVVEGQQVF